MEVIGCESRFSSHLVSVDVRGWPESFRNRRRLVGAEHCTHRRCLLKLRSRRSTKVRIMGLRETLEARLAGGQDDAMLRLSLAQLHLRESDWAAARGSRSGVPGS